MVTDDIALFLMAQGLGVYDPVGTTSTIFVGSEPPAPATMIAILDYTAAPVPRGAVTFDSPLRPNRAAPRIQVVCRDPDYLTAKNTALKAWLALSGVLHQILGTAFYYQVKPLQSEPFTLGLDLNNLWRVVCNYEAVKSLSPVV